MCRWLLPTALLLATGCGVSVIDVVDVEPPPIDSTRGTILGVVSTIGEEDELHIIAGARVSAHGIETVTDALGRFVIDGVPTDVPITVTAREPQARPGDRGEHYADNRIVVTVPSTSRSVTPDLPLLRACGFEFDGLAGGSAACAGDDRASFVFPAGAVAAERVIARVAALDPTQVADRLAFPSDASEPSVAIIGGVDVELLDEHGGALQLAPGRSATARFELAATEAAESELALQWFDEASGTWTAQPSGRVVREGARSFYEFEAQHFSSYRAIRDVTTSPNACITFTPRICREPGCERAIFISAVDYHGFRVTRGTYGPEAACLPVYGGSNYKLYGRWIDPNLTLNPSAPMYFGRTRVTVPFAFPGAHYECTADCVSLEVVLNPYEPGCVTGTFSASCGLGCVEPYSGQLDVLVDGQRIASVDVPAECGGDVCVPVGFVRAGEIVQLETTSGHRLSFSPDVASRGEACSSGACTPSPKCEDLGDVTLACGQGLGTCVEAEFTSAVLLNDPACASTPSKPHSIQLDASTTIGLAARYRWRIFRDDALLIRRESHSTEASFCVEAGQYRVLLTTESSTNFHLPVYDSISHDVGVSTFSIVATPGSTVPAGMPVTLTVVTPDDPAQYTFVWNRIRLGDPSRIGDGPSVTFTPSGARDTYRVEGFIDGTPAGSAEIVIEAGALDPLQVMINASELAPREGQRVDFNATAIDIDLSMERPVTCVYEGLINAVHWVLHRPEGDEVYDFEAPAGTALACSPQPNGPPSFGGALTAGNHSLELSVISLDGRTGAAQHTFIVYPF